MSIKENENCCNSNAEKEIQENNDCEKKMETQDELMNKIKALDFSIIELALYLDTHPNDEKVLCLHKEYTNEVKILKDKYQRKYGPLTIFYPCNKWRWLENPWPWERGNN